MNAAGRVSALPGLLLMATEAKGGTLGTKNVRRCTWENASARKGRRNIERMPSTDSPAAPDICAKASAIAGKKSEKNDTKV